MEPEGSLPQLNVFLTVHYELTVH